jgi:alpha-L-fucosidase
MKMKQLTAKCQIMMLNKSLLSLTIAAALLQTAHAAASADPFTEPAAHRDERMEWFREARFGMFIHWGLYSVAAGEWDGKPTTGAGEWIMSDMKIPVSQYTKLVPQFNPVKFDAREWVAIAKNAGMKYIVITTKHHDGFALYPSAITDWDIGSTPFQRDPLKELAAACQEQGIKLCFYHSIMDWHHPDYAPRPPWNDVPTEAPQFDRYVDFMKGQIKELLTGYGPIGLLWFDGHWEETWNYDRGADLYSFIRKLQPDIIINNRVGKERPGVPLASHWTGDYGTPEQYIPANGYGAGVDWESCMTMNRTWGFKKNDHDWKSTETLVRNLIDCASKGGNYLLNVGPTGEGLIPGASVERLKQVGNWMKVNSEAIYGTKASPFTKQFPWGRCTTKVTPTGTTLYFHVFNWPTNGQLFVRGLKNEVAKAALLTEARTELKTKTTDEGLFITVPENAPDAISTTLAVQLKGDLDIAPLVTAPDADGTITLAASDARLHGTTFRYEQGGPLDNIGFWSNPNDWADWQLKLGRAGKYEVVAEIAAPASGAFELAVGNDSIRCVSPMTASYMEFRTASLGFIHVSEKGLTTLSVRPIKDEWQPMNLKSIRMKPVSVK